MAGRQVELIDGQIVNTASERPIHRATYRRSVKYLEAQLGNLAVVFVTTPLTLLNDGEPQPDICIAKVRSPPFGRELGGGLVGIPQINPPQTPPERGTR